MRNEIVLQEQWKQSGDAGPIPDYIQKRFSVEIEPLLSNAIRTDPYVIERINALFTDWRLKRSAEILYDNAKAGESLVSLVGKVQTAKIVFKVGAVFAAGVAAAVILAFGAFTAGVMSGDGWNNYRIARAEAEAKAAEADAEYQTERLAFLERVNKDLMTCKNGTVQIQQGKRVCFYETNGWFIE